MAVYFTAPGWTGKQVKGSLRGVEKEVLLYGGEPEPVQSITAGAARMTVVPVALSSTEQGVISPRDDGGTSLNLIDIDPTVTEFSATDVDGNPISVEVLPKRQGNGWGSGRHWMPPIDKATGLLKFRRGRKGRKYFVTKRPRNDPGGKGGYTRQDIATETGFSLATISNDWIIASTVYGRSADKPLEMNLGFSVWGQATNGQNGTGNMFASNWLILEKGYDYRDGVWEGNRGLISREASGESPMHPTLITSYGTGTRPRLIEIDALHQNAVDKTWFAFQDLDLDRGHTKSPFDCIVSNIDFLKKGYYVEGGPSYRTLYRIGVFDASNDVPAKGLDYWDARDNHTSGSYIGDLKSLLILESWYDHNGWREGYSETSTLAVDGPHPPSLYAHNLYLQYLGDNTTIRRTTSSRASSQGIQCRTSSILEDVWLVDNNMAGNQMGRANGDIANAGNYAMVNDVVITSAAFKEAPSFTGAKDRGIEFSGYDGTINRFIVMHRSDPNNPTEIAEKGGATGDYALQVGASGDNVTYIDLARGFFINAYIHRWNAGQDNAAARGANTSELNATTLQNFAPTRAGGGVTTIDQYFNWMRTLSFAGREAERKAAMGYFQTPWGLYIPPRVNPTTATFVPSPLCSGILWADKLNWSTYDVPGVEHTDSADLRGAYVRFGEVTATMATVDGEGSPGIEFSSGQMTVQTLSDFAEVKGIISGHLIVTNLTNVDQIVWESGTLDIRGAVSGTSMKIDGRYPEVLLGPNYTISNGEVFDLRCGLQGGVGWDGTGTAELTGATGGKIIFRYFDGAFGQRMAKLERFKLDGDAADPTVAVTWTMQTGFVVELDTTGHTEAAGAKVKLTKDVTVIDNGAILPANVAVESSELVWTVPS